MAADFTLLNELESFVLARYREEIEDSATSAVDRKNARNSIPWINSVAGDAKDSRRALPLGVAILARHAKRWSAHPAYDPLWNTIDID